MFSLSQTNYFRPLELQLMTIFTEHKSVDGFLDLSVIYLVYKMY